MAFKGPAGALAKLRQRVGTVADGRLAARAREVAGESVFREAVRGWRTGTSPYGDRWKGSRGQPVSLYRTGELFRSLRLVKSPLGFKLATEGPTFGRHSLATVQAYGGTIRAGVAALLKVRGRRARNARKLAGYADAVKPMTFKVGGRWVSKYTVRIQGNPMLPRGTREIPPRWAKAIEIELEVAGRRHFGLR